MAQASQISMNKGVAIAAQGGGPRQRVFLIDGSGYIFRAYYAVQPLSNAQGFPTNALFGFSRMLLKLLKERDSDHVVMVFDAGRETFRNEIYPAYKANRSAPPEDLVPQFPYFREIVRAVGIKALELPGYEADDVIGTLARRLLTAGHEVVVVSGDKDLMQLVTPTPESPSITVWDPMKDKHIGVEEVRAKFGVGPEQVVEVLALQGDTSDNIPGLDGVGPKTATQLIEKYGNVDNLLACAAQVAEDSSIRNRKKIAEQLELSADQLRLSRKLVAIDCDAPVLVPSSCNGGGGPVQIVDGGPEQEGSMGSHSVDGTPISELSDGALYDALKRSTADRRRLRELFDRFQFGSLLTEMNDLLSRYELGRGSDNSPAGDSLPAKVTGPRYSAVFASGIESFLALLSEQSAFAFDLETTSLNPLEAEIVGASFCFCELSQDWNKHESFYLPISHNADLVPAGESQIGIEEFFEKFGDLLRSEKVAKIGQNLKYDISVISAQSRRIGKHVLVRGVAFDCMLASYLLKPDSNSHGLTQLAQEILGREVIEYSAVTHGLGSFREVPIENAVRYGCQDAHYAWAIAADLRKRLEVAGLSELFEAVEMPLVPVLSEMELAGVLLDTKLLKSLSIELDGKLVELNHKIIELCGMEFNLNSPKQLAGVLFEHLKLNPKGIKKTKTGISTDADALEKLSAQHAAPKLLLEYRAYNKLKNTYVDVLPTLVSPRSGRLHSRFNQTGTGTGRLSSSDPNLQNIPVQTEMGRRIRSAFIAPSGCTLISADYSQIELRLLAHLSQDATLIRAFNEGADVHAQTAREILGIPLAHPVLPEQRRIGKTINFGIVYGMGPHRLSRELEIPYGVAEQYIHDYFARYPGVRSFFDRVEREAEQRGFVSTIYGRKRFIESIDPAGRDKGFVMRAALNAPLQGSAADLVKVAMIELDRRIRGEKLPIRLLIQVHDELVFECVNEAVTELKPIIRQVMEGVRSLAVPLKVDVGSGVNWDLSHA